MVAKNSQFLFRICRYFGIVALFSGLVNLYLVQKISNKRSLPRGNKESKWFDLFSCSKSEFGEDMFAVFHFFGSQKSGTFIELGALDGVTSSNTYLFETCLNWTGVLIEPSKENFELLKKNRPNQKLLNTVICDDVRTVEFIESSAVGGIVEYMTPSFIEEWHSFLSNKELLLEGMTVKNNTCTMWGPFEASFSGGCATDCAPFDTLESAAATCFSTPACAAITAIPNNAGLYYEMRSSHKLSRSESREISYMKGPCTLTCVPLHKALSTGSRHKNAEKIHFDFLSIDVAGAELEVLKTISFRTTSFSVISIETDVTTKEKNMRIRSFLSEHDYVYYGGDGFGNDWFHHLQFFPSKSNFGLKPFEPFASPKSIHQITSCREYLAFSNMSFLSPGYVFVESVFQFRSDLVFLQNSSQNAVVDLSRWASIPAGSANRKLHTPRRILESVNPKIIDGYDEFCSTFMSFKERLEVQGAIFIADFTGFGMISHYYHLLEHLLGIWTTKSHFVPAEEPQWIVLPHTKWIELSQVHKDLLEAVFPQAQVVDTHQFQMVSRKFAVHFLWAVASDRSAADHGSVNQMLTGILPRLKLCSSALVSRITASLQLSARRERLPFTLTYVSRRGIINRRLDDEVEQQLLSEIREGCREVIVNDVLFNDQTFAQQVQVARSSHLMLGVHGNGLSNALWMVSPGALLELFPPSARILAYQQFAEARGLWYVGFVGPEGAEFPDGSCGNSAEEYARLCRWVLSQTGQINTIIGELPRKAVVQRVRDLARRVAAALGAGR